MKFETTPAFDADYRRLKPAHAAEFRKVVHEKFVAACDAFAANPSTAWPASLRVKSLRSAAGVLEMTSSIPPTTHPSSFASPDGRATFEFVMVDDELCVRWRRVGDLDVFNNP